LPLVLDILKSWEFGGCFGMRLVIMLIGVTALTGLAGAQRPAEAPGMTQHVGFDRNEYPGDDALPVLRRHFSFVGYWLTNPPGEQTNSWKGKREVLVKHGFGFLVLANGKVDAVILKARKASGKTAEAIGRQDAMAAVSAAKAERFPAGTILFLDQEEGGRLLPEQADYLLGWTEAVARSGFRPGAYVSGQAVPDGPGKTITTAQDIRARVASKHLHEVALWVYDDACPPSNGCTLRPPALSAGPDASADVVAWQYAQSPRRPEITASCAKTYAADGNCYVPEAPGMHLDLSVARSADPSHGR
jgi:hypothetical protein